MSNQVFLLFISVLLSGVIWSYGAFQSHFSEAHIYKEQVEILRQAVEREQLKTLLASEKMAEFRQQVATVLPEFLKTKGKGEKGYPIRQLASVTHSADADKIREHISGVLFERAKDKFRTGNFEKANLLFLKIIEEYSFSVHVAESYFLLAEGQFQLGQLEKCVKTVERMVDLFPGNELTGFALLRMGRIFEIQRRPEEALEIYKTVLRSFPQRGVASQAARSLRSVDL
ncbi:MAG: tetratricopeptide repeat protein [Bdellovibrionales bacterium]|nr:tetratricopeptide repeat protein [Bdellovibrionales bacterium]